MNTVTVLYTKRLWNPISWLIRFIVPRSLFAPSRASHALIVDSEYYAWEAHMLHGVHKVPLAVALRGATVVKEQKYVVSDADRGVAFGVAQQGKRYDWAAALGLALAPKRLWQKDDAWECVEFVAAWLAASGRDVFTEHGRVTLEMMMSLKE